MKNTLKKIIPSSIIKVINKINKSKYRYSTSLSDNLVYPNYCLKASNDLVLFSNFRSNNRINKAYREVLEHVTKDLGLALINEITLNNDELLSHLDLFKKNDEWGNPELFEYDKIGKISPTTLRYVKVLGDLKHLFGELDSFKICEIGVGYGGQCRIINSINNPFEYTLVDIKPALMLSQRYLDNYVLGSIMKYKTMNELEKTDYDLIISNYAFTELPRNIQEVYLKKIILNSKRGYITYNEITPENFNSYKREELIKLIPNSHIIDEKPITHKNNCIIIWGDNL